MATNKPKSTEDIEETKVTEEMETPAVVDNREDIFIPKGYANDEPNMQIIVNGVVYVLPKGQTSKVPPFVAAEFRRSQKAEAAMDKRIDQMKAASK